VLSLLWANGHTSKIKTRTGRGCKAVNQDAPLISAESSVDTVEWELHLGHLSHASVMWGQLQPFQRRCNTALQHGGARTGASLVYSDSKSVSRAAAAHRRMEAPPLRLQQRTAGAGP